MGRSCLLTGQVCHIVFENDHLGFSSYLRQWRRRPWAWGCRGWAGRPRRRHRRRSTCWIRWSCCRRRGCRSGDGLEGRKRGEEDMEGVTRSNSAPLIPYIRGHAYRMFRIIPTLYGSWGTLGHLSWRLTCLNPLPWGKPVNYELVLLPPLLDPLQVQKSYMQAPSLPSPSQQQAMCEYFHPPFRPLIILGCFRFASGGGGSEAIPRGG